nr:radical SAM protein [Rhodospirillum rubrum]
MFVSVNVTTRCNLDCVYCYMQPRSGIDMAQRDFERVIDDLAQAEVFLVTLSGGEPFLHPQFSDLFRYAHKRFKHVMTLTNGTALRPCHFDAMKDVLRQKGALTIQVSLDALDGAVNAMTRAPSRRTVDSIAALAAAGCHVVVAIVVTRHNAPSIPATIEALSVHTRWFHIMTVQDVRSRSGIEKALKENSQTCLELWDRLRALAEDRGLFINLPTSQDCDAGCASGAPCMAGFSHCVIDPDLKVRPCDRMTDIDLGNLRAASLSEIWNAEAIGALLTRDEPICRRPPLPD